MGDLPTILTVLNGVLAIALGIFVFLRSPLNRVHRTLAILAFFAGVWALSSFLPLEDKIVDLIGFAGISLAAVANLHFASNLAGRENRKPIFTAYLLSLVLVGLLAAPSFGFAELGESAITAIIQKTWLAVWLLILILPALLLFIASKETVGAKKYQLKFVLWEYVTALVFGTGSLALFYDSSASLGINLIRSPHLLTVIHLIIVFRFFVEYKFLKLKIIAPKFFGQLISTLTGSAAGLLAHQVVSLVLPDGNKTSLIVVGLVVATFIYDRVLNLLDLSSLFESANFEHFRKVISEFKNQNVFYASIEELEKDVKKNFHEKIGIDCVKIVMLDLEERVSKFPELEKHFNENAERLVTSEEEYLQINRKIECPYLQELKSLGDVCFPLFQHTSELIGFLTIKKSLESDIYVEEELELIEGATHYIALSLMGILYTDKLRQQAKKLREDFKKLKTLDNAKDAFIADVSHELRTPATAIKGYAEMIAAPNFGELSSQQKDFAVRIQKNINWLLDLLRDILELTKLESEQIKFKFEKIAIKKLVENIVEKWRKPCEEKKITLKLVSDSVDGNFLVNTDPEKLEELLGRLITNAHKFTQEGGITVFIKTSGEFLEIAIQDTGVGIATEKLDNIWDKFFQAEDFLEKGDSGTGLGLAIVKKLVENLKGKVSVQSELKKGSTFTLLIPLQYE